jgi:hypothetical protein
VRMEEDIDNIAGVTYISSERRAFAPVSYSCRFIPTILIIGTKPGWMVSVHYDDGIISFTKPSDFSKKRPDHIVMKNSTEVPLNIVIGIPHLMIFCFIVNEWLIMLQGSYHANDGDERFQPFVLIESVQCV